MSLSESQAIPGLHHVAAISGPAQDNLEFWTGTLHQRLVKRTVNFDDSGTYHLYYGDNDAAPGSIMTFFPFVHMGPSGAGAGIASAVAYAISNLDQRMGNLAEAAINFDGPFERFGERAIALNDPDGLRVELIERGARDEGFHSVTFWLDEIEPTATVPEAMGYKREADETITTGGTSGIEIRLRYSSIGPERGSAVDLMVPDTRSIGRAGAGTIHHVAFRARTVEEQQVWRRRLSGIGRDVTSVINRQYFDAIYFYTLGGVSFEIATDPPGFSVDEYADHLGEALKQPEKYEADRARIEKVLPEIRVPA
ncbi:VOC family protein [Sulfitobacter sp. F26169L]|uniref:VOC family protein n=1 Tax=Sulfitobacter sp. F26169L TaxID=2996015 RepID=UPI002260B63F|nr:VOC family protein [Sulfitobacter sp. F26169L]MCX7567648.1 VOC family protein [Sulfitobacter sp. F26169L]